MLDILNTIMMVIGYALSAIVGLFSLVYFLITNIDDSNHRYFAWLPRYVLIWGKDYKEGKFIWLRYYQKTSKNSEYYALDGSQAPKGIDYVVSRSRKRFFG